MRYTMLLLITIGCVNGSKPIRSMDEEYQKLSKFLTQKIKERDAFEKQLSKPLGDSPKDNFLKAITGVESSFGKNLDHPTIEEGMHSGASAMGNYALMPNTVRDIATKVSNPDTVLGKQLPFKTDLHDVKALRNLEDDVIKQRITPELENKLARLLAMEVMAKSGNEEEAAYRWNMGQNIPRSNITQEKLDNHDYVQKFKRIRVMLRGVAQN